jgi:hypothetical protein
VESGQIVRENLTIHSRRPGNEVRSLAVLAAEYMARLDDRHFLGFTEDGRDISYIRLSQAILDREDVTDDPYQRYRNILLKLQSTVHQDLIQELESVVDQMMEHIRQSATVTASAVTNLDVDLLLDMEADVPTQTVSIPDSVQDDDNPVLCTGIVVNAANHCQIPTSENATASRGRKKQTFGTFDVDRSVLTTNMEGDAKLRFMRTTWNDCGKVEKSSFSGAFRVFHSQTLRPLMDCLTSHFGGDEVEFLKSWSTSGFKHRLFGQKLCSGKSECKLRQ